MPVDAAQTLASANAAALGRVDLASKLIRGFGWAMIALMVAFIANAFLTFGLDLPGTFAALDGSGGGAAFAQAALYVAALAAALAFAFAIGGARTLRMDSVLLHNVNCYLIRAAFWTVLLIGTVDAAISFLRVQDLNEGLFGAAMADNLKLSDFRGVYIHLPLIALGFAIATVTRTLGFIWLALLVVVAEVLIVVGRFVFSYEQTFMADLVRFWYAALFLFASAYTLFEDGHVRVDVFYAGFGETTKGYANAWGTVLFGISLCWVILIIGMENKASIIVSPILYFESAQEGFGMMVKYMMAGFLGVFASTMMIQFVSFLFESVADYRDEPGRRERAAEIAH